MCRQCFCQFGQRHVSIEYTIHSFRRQSDECSEFLEVFSAWMSRIFVNVAFFKMWRKPTFKAEIIALYVERRIE